MSVLRGKMTEKRIFFLLFLLVWSAQIITAFYFCGQKQGFHEDEYYTYYSTARTNGLIIEDGAWMERDAYRNEFVVLKGQAFQYGLVKLVQSWDVHPPVYYWIFHTIASLFPGQFSKWFGLVINLTAYGISLFLLRFLALLLTKRNEKLTLLVCLFYGFTPAAMSSVVFIRMYALLTLFVSLCAVMHVRAVQEWKTQKLPVRTFLLPLSVVTYLGFLTHYYYFIFLFFMAAAFCIYLLWRDRNLWNSIRYALFTAAAFFIAWLTYPACLGQMFRGQRGAQATGNFFDLSNTLERFSFFWQILDEYVFGRMLPVLLLAGVLSALYVMYQLRRKNERRTDQEHSWWILLVAVAGYFVVVSKTALLLGNTSVRYQTPVYGMIVLLLFMTLDGLIRACTKGRLEHSGKKWESGCFIAVAVVCMGVNIGSFLFGRVVFLYPEDAERIAFAEEMSEREVPVLYLYDAGQSWCVWDSADEFFAYDKIYFASQDSTEPIADDVITGSRQLVVYLGDSADKEAQIRRVLSSNTKLTEYELKYQEKYCGVYYFYGTSESFQFAVTASGKNPKRQK